MSMRRLLQTFLRPAAAVMSSMSFMYTTDTETKKPTMEQKLIFESLDLTKLTHEYMIKQSTVDAVNSASQALTVTYMAIISTSDEYKALLGQLIALSRDTVHFQVSEHHWDMILELRSQVQAKKDTLANLSSYVDSVHKMAMAAVELSYLSGMDNLSITLSQRIDDALRNIKEELNSLALLEKEYCEIQEECIRKTKTDVPEEPKESDPSED